MHKLRKYIKLQKIHLENTCIPKSTLHSCNNFFYLKLTDSHKSTNHKIIMAKEGLQKNLFEVHYVSYADKSTQI